MSRAFTREDDNESAIAALGERPVSPHRNLVTQRGLALIEAEIVRLREEIVRAEAEGDRERLELAARDLRYWGARRENAELSVPDADSDVVRFGMTVALEDEDGRTARWQIVGEDEAEPAKGSISHISPMAQALFGQKVGELITVNGREWEIVDLIAEA
ncbi:transcription elongation GreA/GreB family factor [Aquamicrobium lusatiense]|uniref:Transcription elongation GreA/GreB family factor n=1 Tax=Aquamicrobium lusatiense TaxID=89772 RepID=A0A7W9VTZ1_9HYPH|nr:GreA/GreB family elongation factor [Aquamicrobium lusatiense]MBB6012289.1 transcription elongation GreA/GreB family factor [Aquamicrobium lusatiense]